MDAALKAEVFNHSTPYWKGYMRYIESCLIADIRRCGVSRWSETFAYNEDTGDYLWALSGIGSDGKWHTCWDKFEFFMIRYPGPPRDLISHL